MLVVPLAAACGGEKAGAGSGAAEAERPVTGVRWTVDSVTVDGATHRAPGGAHLTLGEDGRATGSYGCNLFEARLRTDGDRVRLTDPGETEPCGHCDERVMSEPRRRSPAPWPPERAERQPVATEQAAVTLTLRLRRHRASHRRPKDSPLSRNRWNVTTPDGAGRAHLTFDKERGAVKPGIMGCNQVQRPRPPCATAISPSASPS
ncbi:Heat shock protein HslJ OS=Streptomyces albaduncus OX=68172 GN=FHS32_004602 PE=4 SV=1 [Streptomyces griseoloalbus]